MQGEILRISMVLFGIDFSVIELVLFGALFFCLLILLLYYSLIYLRLALYKNKKQKEKQEKEPVSVVVYAKNQAYLLKDKLFSLLEQEYPNYEVIVVNHASQDETSFILKVFTETYKHLKIVDIQEDVNIFQGRKYPLSIGIKCAKNDIIILTDAESVPASYQWISEMEKRFVKGIDIVLGYVGRELGDGFSQYTYAAESASYLGAALMKSPYMGIGKNLAYRRSFFFEKGGFIKHYAISPGDDVLFVNKNSTSKNTAMVINENSFVTAKSFPLFDDLVRYRRNKIKLYFHFKAKDKFLRIQYPLMNILYYALFIALLVIGFPYEILVGTLVLKFGWHIFTFYKYSKRFKQKKIFIFAPLFELFFLIFDTFLAIPAFIKRT